MNKLIEHSHLPRALSGNITFGFLAALNIQKLITVLALLLLLVAVQVSTQNIGDWYVFGLNVLEMTTPVTPVFTEVSNVTTGLHTDLGSDLGSGLSAGLTTGSDIVKFFSGIGVFTQQFVIGVIECALD
ncbi:MAG: hypothetical protein V5788_07305 [Shewanella sp.]